ncbi:MAG: hypothetical protein ACREEP_20435, partial [Dongiaceae bacterium]
MSGDASPSGSSVSAAPSGSTESPAIARSRGKDLLVRIATERPLLLIVLIVALVAVMIVLEPTTFPRPANAA